jgi:TPR repeat protein
MKGDADSAYSVAMMLLQGRGVPQRDAKRALSILANLAQQARHPWSCFSLAMLRMQQFTAAGYSDSSDEMRSVKRLLQHAANHKVAPAALNLSNCYFRGVGTPVDAAQGLAWLRSAARLGDPVAATQLGTRLTQGMDVEADAVRGFKLFLLAAESGYLEAVHNVGGASCWGRGPLKTTPKPALSSSLLLHRALCPVW